MDNIYHQCRKRFSFKNATIALTTVNVLIFLFLLRGFFTSSSSSSSPRRIISAQLRYIKEAREIRLAMQPLQLIKRVKEIQQEASVRQETEQQKKDVKQNRGVDLSKRLNAVPPSDYASSLKAFEEWSKRKMERAKQRDLEKTGGVPSSKTSLRHY